MGNNPHPNGPNGTFNYSHASVTQFIATQGNLRDQRILVLKTTPEQDRKIIRYMEAHVGQNAGKLSNNCAQISSEALHEADQRMPISRKPSTVLANAREIFDNKETHIAQFHPVGDRYQKFDPHTSAKSNESKSAVLAANRLGYIQINGAVGGGTAWGQQTSGGFVDPEGSNIDLGGDSSPGFLHLVAPEK
jgi:hypothetical protein